METFRRILRITSHAGHFRYLAMLEDRDWITRREEIPEPFGSGPTQAVYHDPIRQKDVIVVETAHRRFDVFEVPASVPRYPTDAAATEAWIAKRRGRA